MGTIPVPVEVHPLLVLIPLLGLAFAIGVVFPVDAWRMGPPIAV
jgi:hypothetical protein